MKETTKLSILLGFLIILGLFTAGVIILQFEKAWNSKVYRFEDGEIFCNNSNMTYEVYFNGDKYCDDENNLYPIKVANGELKFVKFVNVLEDEE